MITCKECGMEFEHSKQFGAHWAQLFCSFCIQKVEDGFTGFWSVVRESTNDRIRCTNDCNRFAITLHTSYMKAEIGLDNIRTIHGAIGQMEAEAMVHALANNAGGYVVYDGMSTFPHPAYSNDRLDRYAPWGPSHYLSEREREVK